MAAAALTCLLLFVSPMLISVWVSAQTPVGNWTVTGQDLVQNESLALNGNLTVQSGGNLTLENVNLVVDASTNGQYSITVLPGGSMYVYDSKITGLSASARYSFIANGANFVMKVSELSGAGWCDMGDVKHCYPSGEQDHQFTATVAPLVETDGAIVEDSNFSQNGIGLIVGGSHAVISGNTFDNNDLGALGIFASVGDVVKDNQLRQAPASSRATVMDLSNANETMIADDTVLTDGLSSFPTGQWPSLASNGVTISDSYGTVVKGDSITVANIAVFIVSSDNTTVSNDVLIGGENGINTIYHGVDTTVVSSKITAYSTAGVTLDEAHGSTVANNTFTGIMPLGVQIDHTSNSTVLNNVVSLTNGLIGVYISSSQNDLVAGNNISGAYQGVGLYGSSDNATVRDNNVGGSHSIVIQGATGDVIYGNNFEDLLAPAGGPVDERGNSWSQGTTGNHWSYYTTSGTGLDGCRGSDPSCFVGDIPYVRTSVSPNGLELYSPLTPFTIRPVSLPHLRFVPFPQTANRGSVQGNSIVNQVTTVNSGDLTYNTQGNLSIINSTLILGKDGPVNIGDQNSGSTILIKNSRIVDAGYGSNLGTIPSQNLVIVDSVFGGVYTQDLGGYNVTVKDSVFLNSQQAYGFTVASANYLTIVNDTMSYDLFGVRSGCITSADISDNTILNPINSGITITPCASNQPVDISGNTIVGAWGNGIATTNSAVIAGNNITESQTPIIVNNNNLIVNNTVSNSSVALVIYQGGGNVIYHNNFINDSFWPGGGSGVGDSGTNTWDRSWEGNYWSNYAGSDKNLDGIGDTPFPVSGYEADSYPVMQPSGWLTKFYLTLNTNLPATTFTINGSSFVLAPDGSSSIRLGYVGSYSINLPLVVGLSNGTELVFKSWGDGLLSPGRTLSLSSNETISASYSLQASITNSTTSTSSSTTTMLTNSSARTTTASTPPGYSTTSGQATPTPSNEESASTSGAAPTGGGGIPEFPFMTLAAVATMFIVLVSYLSVRLRRNSMR